MGVSTQAFWGGLRLMVLAAFYASRPGDQPLSFDEVVCYVWLGQALLVLLPWSVDGELASEIRSGAVAYALLRPVDLYTLWFARTLAHRVARASMRAAMMLPFAMALLPAVGLGRWALGMPPSGQATLLFAVSLAGMVLLATAITMLMQVSLLFTLSGEGINRLMPALVMVLSGSIVPLPLFPDWLQPFLQLQPVRGLADVPFRIYAGDIAGARAVADLGQQLAWTLACVVLGRAWLAHALRRVVVQGG